MRRLAIALTGALIAALVSVGAAQASSVSGLYTKVLSAYQANGRIPPCEFTSPQLEWTRNHIDTYGQQYFADFIGAIQTALTARASGACSASRTQGVAGAGAARGGGSRNPPGTPALPSSVTDSTSSGVPLLMAVLIALGAVLAAMAVLARWARARGVERGWTASRRHGAAEARYRAEGWWLEFRDRLRS